MAISDMAGGMAAPDASRSPRGTPSTPESTPRRPSDGRTPLQRPQRPANPSQALTAATPTAQEATR